ncbi:MAG: 4Fe-4S binding protein [Chloroflexota bacterium]
MMIKQMADILIFGNKKAEAPSMDGILESMDKHLDKVHTLIEPTPESKPRTPFNSGLPASEMSLMNITPRQRIQFISRAIPLVINMMRASRMYGSQEPASQTHATPEFLEELESMAYEAGVKDIAYVEVPRYAIFEGKGIPAKYAIVYTVEMDKAPIDTSPSFDSQYEVIRGYKNMAVIGNKLAKHMHKAGFEAYPGTALGGLTDYVHLAEIAGLGAIGYHGLLISPTEGARLRINTIYINIENLPLSKAEDNEHLWVRDFCAMCKKCVRQCPVDAIYEEPKSRGDGGMQTIEHATCRDYFTKNFGCAVCLKVCPFSQVGYDKVQARFKGNPDAPQFMIPVDAIPVQ